MTTVRIVVDSSSLMFRRNITGTLAFVLDGLAFPAIAWNDFVVVVLGWWCTGGASILDGRSADLLFMDGPYSIRAHPDGHVCRLEFLLRDRELVAEGTASTEALASSMRGAADAVVSACESREWRTPDVDMLAHEHARLAAALAAWCDARPRG
jgi:hypothetical protein